MSYQNKRQTKNKILLDILKDIDLNKISNKEAAFFNKETTNFFNKSSRSSGILSTALFITLIAIGSKNLVMILLLIL